MKLKFFDFFCFSSICSTERIGHRHAIAKKNAHAQSYSSSIAWRLFQSAKTCFVQYSALVRCYRQFAFSSEIELCLRKYLSFAKYKRFSFVRSFFQIFTSSRHLHACSTTEIMNLEMRFSFCSFYIFIYIFSATLTEENVQNQIDVCYVNSSDEFRLRPFSIYRRIVK